MLEWFTRDNWRSWRRENAENSGLTKSLARRHGVFSSWATKIYQRSARRTTLNTGLPRNVHSKLRARGYIPLQPRRRNNVLLACKNELGKPFDWMPVKAKKIAILRQTAIELMLLEPVNTVYRFHRKRMMCAKWVTDKLLHCAQHENQCKCNDMTCEINVLMN